MINKKNPISILLFCIFILAFKNAKTQHASGLHKTNPVDSLLNAYPEYFSKIIAHPLKYKIQIIYTRIDRDVQNKPFFTQYSYKLDSLNYFYCASMVKLPCSILALEKINRLNVNGLTRNSTMFTDSSGPCQKRVQKDTSAPGGIPTLAHYIKKMLLVSDNLAYGRVYEFLTPDYIQNRLTQLSYPNIRIMHRFDGGCKGIENLITNPVLFYDAAGKLLYKQEQTQAITKFNHPLGNVKLGKAYINDKGKKINEPKDFTTLNFMSLQNIHDILKSLIFLPYQNPAKQYLLTTDDLSFLLKHLRYYPRQVNYPKYDNRKYPDSYKKYLMYGDSKKAITDTNIRIYNIVGQSYGFMADCAYICDKHYNTEFMLSAVIYTNENEVLNDGKYEYQTIALPYFANLGKVFYEYEKNRKKKIVPDLSDMH